MGTVPNTVFERLLEAVSENNSVAVIGEINTLLNAGNSPQALARQFVRYLRNVLMARIAGEGSELLQISADERARAARSAVLFSEEDLTRFLQVMLRTYDEMNYRQEQRFHLELGLIKLVHLQRLLPIEEFLSQMPSGGKSPMRGGALPKANTAPARPAPGDAPPAVRPADPPKPAFSPFEADRERKITSEAPAPVATRALTPVEIASQGTAVRAFPAVGVIEASAEVTAGALALAPAEMSAPVLESAAPDADLDRIRQAVCAALEEKGHNSAAAFLDEGQWTLEGDTIQVEVARTKTMIGLTFTPEAEKIVKSAMRAVGASQKFTVVPGQESGTNGTAKPRPAANGSIQAQAMEHPLVKQAMELFNAEVRSVLDLRDKK